ncbi:MAG: YebC/PmpR family DNA-binding transcriptional regulator [Candidatus Yanofskybacteria bacterium]|nr:YebC/PmpR family DNA-binding transcriptional regulator [Candidatus Yanofskybacteria bacterium]
MSGHNKWAQIKHKKALTDKKRSAEFGKLAQAIAVAARDNSDPKTNMKLKAIVEKARSMNMPNENIERAIKRVSDRSANALEELVIEIITPFNIACIATAITDNRNRTLNELRTLVASFNARMAESGSLMWMFKRNGAEFEPTYQIPLNSEHQVSLQNILEALDDHPDVQDIFTNAEFSE